MVWLIFIIGMVNLCLGFALAIYLEPPQARPLVLASGDEPSLTPSDPDFERTNSGQAESIPMTEEIPEEWLEMLDTDSLMSGTFVEASMEVLKLEVGRYRDRLIDIDKQVRGCAKTLDGELIQTLLEELRTANQDWMKQQSGAAGHLTQRNGSLGDFDDMGMSLEEVLMEQAAQIETTCNNIELLDFSSDVAVGCSRLITEIRKLIDLAHDLRDRMQESLLSIVMAEGKIDTIDERLRIDSLTGVVNRTGIEHAFSKLWDEDPNHTRTVSCAMLDIDRFTRLLEKHGALACDKLLTGFGELLADIAQSDREGDYVGRLESECFFAFFGDTGPRSAMSTVEQMRQVIAATTFELGDLAEIDLTVSCSVVAVDAQDTTQSIYARLHKGLREAKKAGRNTTFLDEGEGFEQVEPPEYEIRGKIVKVDL